MSFGFGVSDFLAISQLCWKTYKKCKDSTGNYAQLYSEVGALHNVLKETEELLSQQKLTAEQNARLATCRQGCEDVLKDLDGLLVKYQSLGSKSQKIFDRLGFGMQDVNGIRLRLCTNVSMLDAFNTTSSHARLENRLNLLTAEIRSGKRNGSVVSTETFDSAARNDREKWEALRMELEDIGISSSVITENRQFIVTWFQEAVAMGKLEEAAPSGDSDTSTSVCEAGTSDRDDFFGQHNSSMVQEPQSARETAVKGSMPIAQRAVELEIPSLPSAPKESKPGKFSFPVKLFQARDRVFLEAAKVGDVPLLRKSLDEGVRINVGYHDDRDATALQLAAETGEEEAVRLLLYRGADFNAKDNDGGTALHRAASKGHEHILQLLLEKGAYIESKTIFGHTALLDAASAGHLAVVRLLLEKGADIDVEDVNGCTPLINAATEKQEAIVRLLLDRGARVDARDRFDYTALDRASFCHHEAIVRILRSAGA